MQTSIFITKTVVDLPGVQLGLSLGRQHWKNDI